MRRYPYVHVDVASAEVEEMSDRLFALGAEGIEERDQTTLDRPLAAGSEVTLVASFATEADAEAAAGEIGRGAHVTHVVGDAWRDAWREHFKPTRIGARLVLIAGFVMVAAVEAAFVFWVSDLRSLYVGLILFKVSWVVVHLPIVPLMFHNTPSERRGAIFAAVQMTRAGVTSIATILAGFLAGVVSSYRVCYLTAGLVCLVGIVGAFRLAPARRRPRVALLH